MALADVNHFCAVVGMLPLNVHAVAQMDMAVEQVLGMIAVNELQEGLVALMGKILR